MSHHIGKHHCTSYPLRVNKRVDRPFELVYFDVWDPCQVNSKLSFKYFITFVDVTLVRFDFSNEKSIRSVPYLSKILC